ncbi:APC family permease [Zhenhengia yiwuensis]|uniref:Amino acid permease n=1 Tax=Zhenhengia yiwuensis TaxID=2763666 RepID=A0A926EHY6_9FIRM|nr:amino acid permease [Zhenhengia yiwuensis]MBC8578418.1 amino acid permease [Zhenhengia yiwuensis]MBS5798456.1 amino acid permease [Clostridiales bacterium]
MKKTEYGLFTTIGMIVGIVIGSGIFFRSDNILIATGGSISLGILVFCLAAISIIFGSLTISELATRSTKTGGIIAYAEDTCNNYIACAFGWFHTFLYYPTLICVVSWVIGIYSSLLFGIEATLITQVLIGFVIMCILFICNILSAKLGGYFQNLATVIKLLPLFIIGIAGIVAGDPTHITPSQAPVVESAGWIAAITPIAFAFDGWIIATSLGHEIKDAKKNLKIALIFAPLFILAIYLLYFVGISMYVGPETVMSMGDAHVDAAALKLLGPLGSKVILIFVIISVMGTVNGLIMGLLRLPYSLSLRGMFPRSEQISKTREGLSFSLSGALVAFILCVFWMFIHYFTQKYNILQNSDVSEIAITINYVLYIILYLKVFQMGQKGEIQGFWRGKMNPILAICGSLMILIGSMGNSNFWIYAAFCALLLVAAAAFWHYKGKKFNA